MRMTTITKMAIHPTSSNPIFGEETIHIEVTDEAGGPFFVISQCNDINDGQIRLDFEELDEIIRVANILKNQHAFLEL